MVIGWIKWNINSANLLVFHENFDLKKINKRFLIGWFICQKSKDSIIFEITGGKGKFNIHEFWLTYVFGFLLI